MPGRGLSTREGGAYPLGYIVYLWLSTCSIYCIWMLRWLIDRYGPGSILDWGSDPGAISEKGLSSLA